MPKKTIKAPLDLGEHLWGLNSELLKSWKRILRGRDIEWHRVNFQRLQGLDQNPGAEYRFRGGSHRECSRGVKHNLKPLMSPRIPLHSGICCEVKEVGAIWKGIKF